MASAFKSEFSVSGLSSALELKNSNLTFSQSIDRRGRADSGVRSGLLRVSVLGSDEGVLANWAADPTSAKSGYMVYRDPNGGTLQRIEFKDAYCVTYHEVFQVGSENTDSSYIIHLGLTSRQLIVDGNVHDNLWLDWNMG